MQLNLNSNRCLLWIINFFLNMITVQFVFGNCETNRKKVSNLLEKVTVKNVESSVLTIDSLFNLHDSCHTSYEKSITYNALAEKVFLISTSPHLIYSLSEKAIKNGYLNSVLLEFSQNQWLRKVSPSDYNHLEQLSDSLFFVKYPNANVNLAKTIRWMVREDQRIRLEHRNTNPSDSVRCDSLLFAMKKIDDLNEYLLDSIFTIYGYPVYSLVGCEHNACYLIFHHMGTEFQAKQIHLLKEAVDKQELYQDIHPLIDKVLFKKYGVTLYSTHYSNQTPEKELKVINTYLTLLNLKPMQ